MSAVAERWCSTVLENEGQCAVIGEIHTGLLQSSGAVTQPTAGELLALAPGAVVRWWDRPVRHAASPERLVGVDCVLPSASRTRTRVVGTIATEARITVGHVLQASSVAAITSADDRARRPWSHYLGRPGVLEAWGTLRLDDLAGGFLGPDVTPGSLDLGGIAAHMMGWVQRSPRLDHRPPCRLARTRLRWGALLDPGSRPTPQVAFAVEGSALRTLRVTGSPPEVVEHLPALCLDVALHDWLVTAVVSLVDVAHVGGRPRESVLDHLRPAVDHLLHAWMPGARLPDDVTSYRDEIDRRSGLERQWSSVVARIRDQVSLAAVL